MAVMQFYYSEYKRYSRQNNVIYTLLYTKEAMQTLYERQKDSLFPVYSEKGPTIEVGENKRRCLRRATLKACSVQNKKKTKRKIYACIIHMNPVFCRCIIK